MASRNYIHTLSAPGLPELVLENWPPQLEDSVAARIAEVLTPFVVKRRWYHSKARRVAASRIYDIVTAAGGEWSMILLEFEYEERDREVYLCTVAAALAETADPAFVEHAESAIARIALPDGSRGILHDAIGTRAFSDGLLDAIADDLEFEGTAGILSARHTSAFEEIVGTSHPNLPARVSKAEQSNSSILYGDRFILKIFRKLDAGVNPEFEIGRFLTERGFGHSPTVAGHIEYLRDSSVPMSACILQQFVPNQGDAWEFTLQSAREFYARNSNGVPPRLASEHPMEGNDTQSAALTRRLIGEYLEAAQLLARRTAELHIALTAPDAGPEFVPEPFTDEFRDALHRRFIRQLDLTLDVIRAKGASFPSRVADDSKRLLELEPRIRRRFHKLCESPIHALRIRHHGDYHLGQVLYTGNDFAIIDFEGEPARSLEERRMKGAAMRDVAGMLRSFQYAAYSALPGEGMIDEDRAAKAEVWADYWNASIGQAFLGSYLAVAAGHAFIPEDGAEHRILLDAFLLEKALYEIAYELNNRPSWVRIPLRGILSLMS